MLRSSCLPPPQQFGCTKLQGRAGHFACKISIFQFISQVSPLHSSAPAAGCTHGSSCPNLAPPDPLPKRGAACALQQFLGMKQQAALPSREQRQGWCWSGLSRAERTSLPTGNGYHLPPCIHPSHLGCWPLWGGTGSERQSAPRPGFGRRASRESGSEEGIWRTAPKWGPANGARAV